LALTVEIEGLRPWQRAVWENLQRFNVLVIHRRAGKTVLALLWLLEGAARPGTVSAYIAPQFTQAKRTAWLYLQRFAGIIPGAQFNAAELLCTLPNDSRIYLLGAENPDPIRGVGLRRAVLDEVAQMPSRAWKEVIRPALADQQGEAMFIGTPMGMANMFYELYRDSESRPGWYRTLLTAYQTHALPDPELEALEREQGAEEFAQEMLCDWSAAVRGAYFGREMAAAEREGRIKAVPWDRTLPVHTSWDLGIADFTVIWCWQQAGGEVRAIDLMQWTGSGLPDIIAELRKKPYQWGRHYAPHDIKVRELGSGRSRLEMAGSLGLRFEVVRNLDLMDGIEALRAMIPRTWFDREKCFMGIEALKTYRTEWDDNRRVFSLRPLHSWESHFADAARMFAVSAGAGSIGDWEPVDYTQADRAVI